MKLLKIMPVLALFAFGACNSIQVTTDYDSSVNFNQFKTYAFMKSGIDESKISDLDKRRILRAIEAQMTAKGFTKSETPDLLINVFTDTQKNVYVNNYNNGWGYGYRPWGWNPWMYGNSYNNVSVSTEGVLYIDVLKANDKELIWQGKGTGYLTTNPKKKEQKIEAFVTKILTDLPQ